MVEISVKSRSRTEFIDITPRIAEQIPGDFSGLVHVFSAHTTAGLTINENADPDVVGDMMRQLEKMVPWNGGYSHAEGNSAAHLKASMLGFSQFVPVHDGRLRLGVWQAVYFCEFDGPRQRRVVLTYLRD